MASSRVSHPLTPFQLPLFWSTISNSLNPEATEIPVVVADGPAQPLTG